MSIEQRTRVVTTESGKAQGHHDEATGTWSWLGLPYAAPPLGLLRWQPPRPATPWSGVRDCAQYGKACCQHEHPRDSIMRQFLFADPPECGIGEDCLYLNIWTPFGAEASAPLPVIAFVHGGGHRAGSGSHPVSRGAALAARGAVVVTFNYRLGALGYLAHPALSAETGSSGNYACLDVLAMLAWVQRNIAAFGGDPSRVTLFGQSAGAALVNVLLASPLSRGLFHRAILHSSGRLPGAAPMGAPMKSLAQAEQAGVALVGDDMSADELRRLDPAALEGAPGMWGPIIDGEVLRESVGATYARGGQLDIPILAGYTWNESTVLPMAELPTVSSFAAHVRKAWPGQADELLARYPHGDDLAAETSWHALRRDSVFAYQPWRVAREHARSSAHPVYLFNFMQAPPLPAQHYREPTPAHGYGAYHGAELWYVFQTFDAQPWPWSQADRRLGEAMAEAWVAFAATGHPDSAYLGPWPDFRASGLAMILQDEPCVALPGNASALALFETLHPIGDA